MKFVNTILSQSIRLVQFTGPSGGSLYGSNLTRAFESRYGFLQGPRTVDEYDLSKGITFLHGQFERKFVIDKCMIFNNGVLAEGKVPTEEYDIFIDDVIEWARAELGAVADTQNVKARSYVSQMEIELHHSIDSCFPQFANFGQRLSTIIRSYGQNPLPYGVSGITFHFDIQTNPPPNAAAFVVARREGQPYRSNMYFSSAPLRTTDHLRMLADLEELLAN